MTEYLTITEAAELLRVSVSTVRGRMQEGKYVCGRHYFKRAGARTLFKRAALVEWIETGSATPVTSSSDLPRIPMVRGYVVGVR